MIKPNVYSKLVKNDDGANYQAKAVLAFVQRFIENSIPDKESDKILVTRWENCREQGYLISYSNDEKTQQINIAFFEHRNSDAICAVKWDEVKEVPPTIDNAKFGNVYTDKYDVSFRVGHGEIGEMADYIVNELEDFYNICCAKD